MFLLAEKGRRWEESTEKAPPPPKKAGGEKVEKWKQPQGLNKKERKEKKESLNSIKTINRGCAESETPQLDTWQCSSGKGKSPGAEREVLRVLRPHGERRFP